MIDGSDAVLINTGFGDQVTVHAPRLATGKEKPHWLNENQQGQSE
jgi:hypothetical protein